MPTEPPDADNDVAQQPPGPLMPIDGVTSIVRGIQAFRRGDLILYTVRGEPSEVQELMGQLDRRGVGEVIALIRHQALDDGPAEQEEQEEQDAPEEEP